QFPPRQEQEWADCPDRLHRSPELLRRTAWPARVRRLHEVRCDAHIAPTARRTEGAAAQEVQSFPTVNIGLRGRNPARSQYANSSISAQHGLDPIFNRLRLPDAAQDEVGNGW